MYVHPGVCVHRHEGMCEYVYVGTCVCTGMRVRVSVYMYAGTRVCVHRCEGRLVGLHGERALFWGERLQGELPAGRGGRWGGFGGTLGRLSISWLGGTGRGVQKASSTPQVSTTWPCPVCLDDRVTTLEGTWPIATKSITEASCEWVLLKEGETRMNGGMEPHMGDKRTGGASLGRLQTLAKGLDVRGGLWVATDLEAPLWVTGVTLQDSPHQPLQLHPGAHPPMPHTAQWDPQCIPWLPGTTVETQSFVLCPHQGAGTMGAERQGGGQVCVMVAALLQPPFFGPRGTGDLDTHCQGRRDGMLLPGALWTQGSYSGHIR